MEPTAASRVSRPLVPSDLPWLAHTVYWSRFSDAERLRANQLMGLLVNELFLAIEEAIVLVGLAAVQGTLRDRALSARLDAVLADERRHSEWFSTFNRTYAPELYSTSGFCFISPPAWLLRGGRSLASLPGAWRVSAWLALVTEDWSVAFAEQLSALPVGSIDPAYQGLHRAHRQDELRHVAFDADLLAVARAGIDPVSAWCLARFARVLLAQVMRPRRGALAMVDRFIEEFPRWRIEQVGLRSAVVAVGRAPDYWRAKGVAAGLPMTREAAIAWGLRWDGAWDG